MTTLRTIIAQTLTAAAAGLQWAADRGHQWAARIRPPAQNPAPQAGGGNGPRPDQ